MTELWNIQTRLEKVLNLVCIPFFSNPNENITLIFFFFFLNSLFLCILSCHISKSYCDLFSPLLPDLSKCVCLLATSLCYPSLTDIEWVLYILWSDQRKRSEIPFLTVLIFRPSVTTRISHTHHLGSHSDFFTNFTIHISFDLILVCTVLCDKGSCSVLCTAVILHRLPLNNK